MRIISRAMLRDFWETPAFSDAEQALKAWYDEARHANWLTPQDIKDQFRSVRFVGTHKQYDKINVVTI